MTKLILLALSCLAFQGCVGVVVPKTETTVISDPVAEIYPGTGSVFSRSAPDRFHNGYKPDVTNAFYTAQCTSAWLHQYWGSPSHIQQTAGDSGEIWTYKFDVAWEGVVPFVIIPIPLMLPVAHEKVCFSLDDGRVLRASVIKSTVVGGTYGFIPNPEGGGSFGAWNWAESYK